MIREAIIGATFTLALAATGSAMAAGVPGEVQVKQAGVALTVHPVAGDINLFATYFEPADYAFDDREQYNVNLLYNMNGAPYADGVAVAYEAGMDYSEVGSGAEWAPPRIWTVSRTEVPIELSFDRQFGVKYVLVFDRAQSNMGVRVSGDVSGDGVMNIVDAMLIAQASVGLVTFSQVQKGVADVNCDFRIDIVDALLIAKASVGDPSVTIGCN